MHSSAGMLLVRLKSMGDVLFTLPAVHALKAAFPQSVITFLVSKEYAPLLEGFTGLSSVIELDRNVFKGLHPIKILKETFRVVRQARRPDLALAIDFQGYGETAFLTWASGATQRWGSASRPGRQWAYTSTVPRNLEVHPAADNLNLLAENGIKIGKIDNHFTLPNRVGIEAEEFLAARGIKPTEPILFIQAITSAPQKNWPLGNYLKVAQHWRQQGWQVLFGGGPGDVGILEPARTAGYTVSAGASLLLSAGIAQRSTLILGGDTGLVHLAVALGKRVVMTLRTLEAGSAHPFQHKEWSIAPQSGGLIESIPVETVSRECERAASELRAMP